ncbi:DUF4198 domain-containing protein [Kineobactrum salinum]|uniref:DUF4198 domain-containing protein n=1 Tax=Kineobactrum salinum TaxID=2708301 RepID=A0A6C0U042_9GAMM|nr:DUF4198 domain-containing protein [Kineobactrum salinum]QIB65143.1 DUF4198 domain-containing protein [Kineobactrum salinum]
MTGGETSRQTVEFSAGTLAVQVTTNGEPLKARTYVYYADSGEEASRGRTDKNGDASYRIPPGEYRVKIRPDGIDAPDQVIEGVVVTAGEVAEHSLDIPSGSMDLTVENDGEPLEARTYLRDPELDKEVSRSRTDNRGQASYRVPVGNYTLRIRPDGIDAPDRIVETVSVASGQTTEVRVDFAKEQ